MKKIVLCSAVLFFLGAVAVSFAKESSEDKAVTAPKESTEHAGMLMGKSGADRPMPMGHMMKPKMKMMGAATMVATEDGSVIVLVGHKLLKYDKDLNLVKEVQIPMDMEAMKKMMGECPMAEKMRPGDKKKEGLPVGEEEVTAPKEAPGTGK